MVSTEQTISVIMKRSYSKEYIFFLKNRYSCVRTVLSIKKVACALLLCVSHYIKIATITERGFTSHPYRGSIINTYNL